ncbi:MAG: YihY/virulence factor BrkB family protein [Deltaproteobacteria bacterium]|nr:YihY/virulence factor BrkB family protein [Deltaproteobacteria bacterium]
MGIAQKMIGFPRATRQVYRVFRLAVHEFRVDDGFNLSAALAFFTILCATPLILIVISVLGHMIGQSEAFFQQVRNWVQATLPQVQPDFIILLRGLVDKKVTSGWIGIGFLFFVASFLFTNMEHILDKVLKSGKKRNFWHSRALSVGLIFFSALLFVVPAQVNLLTSLVPERYGLETAFGWFGGNFAYFFAHMVAFFLLLRVVPNRDMHTKELLLGATLFGGLTLLARLIFRWYMGWALVRYSYVYGSLTILVILVLWIYYWSVIFVFCSEVVSALQQLYPREVPSE